MKKVKTIECMALAAKIATGIIPNSYLQILAQESIDKIEKIVCDLPNDFPEVRAVLIDKKEFVIVNVEDIVNDMSRDTIIDSSLRNLSLSEIAFGYIEKNVYSEAELNEILTGLEQYLYYVDKWIINNPEILIGLFKKIYSENIDIKKVLKWHGNSISDIERRILLLEEKIERSSNTNDYELVDVSLSLYEDTDKVEYYTGTDFTYIYDKKENSINIKPYISYFENIKNGKTLKSKCVSSFDTIFSSTEKLPILDLKIVNNSGKSLLLSDIVFKNIKSFPDLEPIPVFSYSPYNVNEKHLWLTNDGWGEMKNVNIDFNINKTICDEVSDKDIVALKNFENSLQLGNIKGTINIDLTDFLPSDSKESIKEKFKEHRSNYLNKGYRIPFYQLYGRLSYEYNNFNNESCSMQLPVSLHIIPYDYSSLGAMLPPCKGYDIQFEANNSNYQIVKSIAHIVKDREAERFVIRISANQSSYHSFDIELQTNLGVFIIKNNSLHIFLPKSLVNNVRGPFAKSIMNKKEYDELENNSIEELFGLSLHDFDWDLEV